jgi:hypothetical protein
MLLVLLILAGSVSASQQALSAPDTLSSISWKSCGHLGSHNLECGRLSVPLDYVNPSTGTATLYFTACWSNEKTRFPFYQFWWSWCTRNRGLDENTSAWHDGAVWRRIWHRRVNQSHSIKLLSDSRVPSSWDIRGVNDTTPRVKCFDSQEVADKFWAGCLWYKGVSYSLPYKLVTSAFFLSFRGCLITCIMEAMWIFVWGCSTVCGMYI